MDYGRSAGCHTISAYLFSGDTDLSARSVPQDTAETGQYLRVCTILFFNTVQECH